MLLIEILKSYKAVNCVKRVLGTRSTQYLIEETIQNTWLRLNERSLTSTEIYQALKWVALKQIRSLKRYKNYIDIEIVDLVADTEAVPSTFTQSLKLREAIERLKPKQQAVIRAYLAGIKPKQFAESNKLSVQTTYTNYKQAIKRLRIIMECENEK